MNTNLFYAILVKVSATLFQTILSQARVHASTLSTALALICALICLPLSGCEPSATDGGFSNPAPGARVYAIEDAVRYNRREQIPQIVECLCSDDELVRFLAIGGLQRMTGQDLGYKFDDPDPIRLVSYRRWRQWTIDEHLAPPEQAYSSTMYPPSRPRPQW